VGVRYHGAKNTAYEEAANVPMYVRGPGVVGGSISGKLVLNNDLAPTFARIAGLALPSYVDGRSLLPCGEETAQPGARPS
jgi:N-acetylglucosamine-6-sulfatase